MPAEIPIEVWITIISYLRHPIPKPNDDRSCLAQQDLTSIIRTCKLFQAIGERLLYAHITIDRPSLLAPSHLPARRRLFAHTQSLRLEYREKNEDLKYARLLETGGEEWARIGAVGEEFDREQMWHCSREIDDLILCLFGIRDSGPTSEIFPKLRKLSIGSIYGGQDGIWRRYKECVKGGVPQSLLTPAGKIECSPFPNPKVCNGLLYELCESSHLSHFCAPCHSGPLQMPSLMVSGGGPLSSDNSLPLDIPRWRACSIPGFTTFGPICDYSFTVHIPESSLGEIEHLPIYYGRNTKWIADASTTDWAVIFRSLVRGFVAANDGRNKLLLGGRKSTATVGIALFCSSAMGESDPAIVRLLGRLDSTIPPPIGVGHSSEVKSYMLLQAMGALIQLLHRKLSGLDDSFMWLPLEAAVPCLACDHPSSPKLSTDSSSTGKVDGRWSSTIKGQLDGIAEG